MSVPVCVSSPLQVKFKSNSVISFSICQIIEIICLVRVKELGISHCPSKTFTDLSVIWIWIVLNSHSWNIILKKINRRCSFRFDLKLTSSTLFYRITAFDFNCNDLIGIRRIHIKCGIAFIEFNPVWETIVKRGSCSSSRCFWSFYII